MAKKTVTIDTVCFARQEECLLAISNSSTEKSESFEITQLEVLPFAPSAQLGIGVVGVGYFELVRTASAVVIEPSTDDRVTPIKHSLATSDLPSQVIISKNAVVKGTDSILRTMTFDNTMTSLGTAGVPSRSNGNLTSWQPNNGAVLYNRKAGSVIQPISIAEGEALSIKNFTFTQQPPNWSFIIDVTFKVSGGGTFNICEEWSPGPGGTDDTCFALFNGTGSGVTLEIIYIGIIEAALSLINITVATDPMIRLVSADACFGGQSITPISHNTTSSVPSRLGVKRNSFNSPLVASLLASSGVDLYLDPVSLAGALVNNTFLRRVRTYRSIYPIFSAVAAPGVNTLGSSFVIPLAMGTKFQRSQIEPITILPGKTFAVILSGNTVFAKYRIRATILQNPQFENFQSIR